MINELTTEEGQSYSGWGSYDWEFRVVDEMLTVKKVTIGIDCMTTLEGGRGMMEEHMLALPPRLVH